jgi:polyisoprenoid-binding protein YceI
MPWTIDFSHSEVNFKVRHMMISHVHGEFERFNGTVNFDEENPALTTVDIQIEAASINTNDPKRNAHLTSPDFLDVEKYPLLSFTSKRVEMLDSEHARLIGDLTIRNITRPATLDVEYLGQAKAPWGAINAGFAASTRINRKDWDLTWNVALETGGMLVGDTIDISIELELTKVAEAELVAA